MDVENLSVKVENINADFGLETNIVQTVGTVVPK